MLQNIRELRNVGLTNFLHEINKILRTAFAQLDRKITYVQQVSVSRRKYLHILTLYFHEVHFIINISFNVGLS
jgi:hypothetical protein